MFVVCNLLFVVSVFLGWSVGVLVWWRVGLSVYCLLFVIRCLSRVVRCLSVAVCLLLCVVGNVLVVSCW